MDRKTKTLLVIVANNPDTFINKLEYNYEIRETYSIPSNENIIFIMFYNLKESEKCYKELCGSIPVYYTISKYELPKDQEKCDSTKNQSTLFITLRNNRLFEDHDMLQKYGDIKNIRLANTTIKCVEYYDSRSADKCYRELHGTKYHGTDIHVRYVWDLSTKIKWELIRATDSIITQQGSRKMTVRKNMFIDIFDECIVENIDSILRKYM